MNPQSSIYNAMGRINRLGVMCIDAYGVACKNGYEGTVEEWLESLKGKSAYDFAKDGGFSGTEEEFTNRMANPSGATWNDLPDKPFGESPTGSDTLTWDGNTEGLYSFADAFFRVSDSVVTPSDLTNGFSFTMNGERIESTLEEFVSTGAFVMDDGFMILEYMLFVPHDNYDLSVVEEEGTLPKGVYFAHIPGILEVTELSIPGYTGFPVFKQLDEKYIPEPMLFGAMSVDLLWTNPNINADFAGQTIALDLSGYTHVLIETAWTSPALIFRKGQPFNGTQISLGSTATNATVIQLSTRRIESTDAGVTLGDANYTMYTKVENSFSNLTVDNSKVKPRKIYGLKLPV